METLLTNSSGKRSRNLHNRAIRFIYVENAKVCFSPELLIFHGVLGSLEGVSAAHSSTAALTVIS